MTHADVARCIVEIFVDHPWQHEPITSFVCEARGALVGFLGVTPRRMRFMGRSILVAVSAHLMVSPDERASLAGVQLQQALFAGPQDLALTDGATDQGLAIWTGLGGRIVPVPSLSWLLPLRPSAFMAATVRARFPLLAPGAAVVGWCAPFADRLLARKWPSRFQFRPPSMAATALNTDTILSNSTRLADEEILRPEYDTRSMSWLLARASRLAAAGALQARVAHSAAGKPIGWYIYYLNRTGISEVLQIVARRGVITDVFDQLCYDAWDRGALALQGKADADLLETLGLRRCFLACGNPWVLAHAKDPELLDAVCQGRAHIARLDGEWCTSVRI
jgi:hypothetical protein